jgi:hypothetical protein
LLARAAWDVVVLAIYATGAILRVLLMITLCNVALAAVYVVIRTAFWLIGGTDGNWLDTMLDIGDSSCEWVDVDRFQQRCIPIE